MEKKISPLGAILRVVICGAVGALAATVCLLCGAWIAVSKGSYGAVETVVVYVSAVVSGLAAGFLAARTAGKNGILNGGAAALLSALTVSIPSAFSTGGNIIPSLICFVCGMCGGIAGVNLRRK
ncbi:MAG: TIGR04086 family membrane protein [Clostridia bacterium]|nr:TIGR04086 family membrane protein [Clostridia bacterium]